MKNMMSLAAYNKRKGQLKSAFMRPLNLDQKQIPNELYRPTTVKNGLF